MRFLAAAAVVALSSSSALAQQAPGQIEPLSPLAQPASPQKDPNTAVVISVSATLGGFLLFAGGVSHDSGTATLGGLTAMYFGPTLGVWYGGGTGAVGLAGRLAGFLMFMHGLSLDSANDYDCLDLSAAQCNALAQQYDAQERDAKIWAYGGLAVWGAATIYDFVDAHRAASRWNREHHLTLAPMVAPHTTGMAVALSF